MTTFENYGRQLDAMVGKQQDMEKRLAKIESRLAPPQTEPEPPVVEVGDDPGNVYECTPESFEEDYEESPGEEVCTFILAPGDYAGLSSVSISGEASTRIRSADPKRPAKIKTLNHNGENHLFRNIHFTGKVDIRGAHNSSFLNCTGDGDQSALFEINRETHGLTFDGCWFGDAQYPGTTLEPGHTAPDQAAYIVKVNYGVPVGRDHVIKNCVFSGTRDAFSVEDFDPNRERGSVLIEDCVFYDVQDDAIEADANADFTVRRCIFGRSLVGASLAPHPGNSIYTDCQFTNYRANGIKLNNGSGVRSGQAIFDNCLFMPADDQNPEIYYAIGLVPAAYFDDIRIINSTVIGKRALIVNGLPRKEDAGEGFYCNLTLENNRYWSDSTSGNLIVRSMPDAGLRWRWLGKGHEDLGGKVFDRKPIVRKVPIVRAHPNGEMVPLDVNRVWRTEIEEVE